MAWTSFVLATMPGRHSAPRFAMRPSPRTSVMPRAWRSSFPTGAPVYSSSIAAVASHVVISAAFGIRPAAFT